MHRNFLSKQSQVAKILVWPAKILMWPAVAPFFNENKVAHNDAQFLNKNSCVARFLQIKCDVSFFFRNLYRTLILFAVFDV